MCSQGSAATTDRGWTKISWSRGSRVLHAGSHQWSRQWILAHCYSTHHTRLITPFQLTHTHTYTRTHTHIHTHSCSSSMVCVATLDRVMVDVEGQKYPLKQMAQIGMPNPSLIVINLSSFPQVRTHPSTYMHTHIPSHTHYPRLLMIQWMRYGALTWTSIPYLRSTLSKYPFRSKLSSLHSILYWPCMLSVLVCLCVHA